MSKERELLKRTMDFLECFVFYSEGLELREAIRDFLSTPEPEQDEEPFGYVEFIEDAGLNFCTLEPTGDYPYQPIYLHPAPRKPFVRLSEEEMKACEPQLGIVKTPDGAKVDGLWIYDFARAIEDALEEKNK